MSVKRCQQEVDSAEFSEWLWVMCERPHGWDATNLAQAAINDIIARVNGNKRSRMENYLMETIDQRRQKRIDGGAGLEALLRNVFKGKVVER